MEKIDKMTFDRLQLAGKRNANSFFAKLLELKPDEGLIIRRAEWNNKRNTPNTLVRRIEKRYSMKFKSGLMADGSGWAVLRVG